MKLYYVTRKYVSQVEFLKDGVTPLGISIKGCAKYRPRPIIKSAKTKSLAYKSHCVAEGDVILSVCGRDSQGMSELEVRQLIKEAESRVTLQLEYEIREPCISSFAVYRMQQMMTRLKKEHDSFGFVLRKNGLTHAVCTEYPIISNVREGGPAERDGKIKAGDRLVQIDGISLSWLSLVEIADILQKREEATFIIEYSICIADSHLECGEESDIVIDCPGTDLGMVLGTTKYSKMVIEHIRQAGLAERCGVFHVGDIILGINNVDTNFLTVPRATTLIRRFQKETGKLTFIPTMGRGLKPRSKTYSIKEKEGNDNCTMKQSRLERLKAPSGTTQKHYTSPSSIYGSFLDKKNPTKENSTKSFYAFQIKTLKLFRDIVQNVSSLQNFIPFLNSQSCTCQEESMDDNAYNVKDKKIDSNKLSQLKAVCTRMKDSTIAAALHLSRYSMVAPFTKNSFVVSSSVEKCASDNNLISEVTDNLTEIQNKKLIPKEWMNSFLAGLNDADMDCIECYKTIASCVLLSQKVTLLLGLVDQETEVRWTCNHLLLEMTQLTMPCSDCKGPWISVSQAGSIASRQRNRMHINSVNIRKPNKTRCIKSNLTTCSGGSSYPNLSETKVDLNLNQESVFYSPSPTPNNSLRDYSFPNRDVMKNSIIKVSERAEQPRFSESLQKSEHLSRLDSTTNMENDRNSIPLKVLGHKDFLQVPKENWRSVEVLSCTKDDECKSSEMHSQSFSLNRSSTPKTFQTKDWVPNDYSKKPSRNMPSGSFLPQLDSVVDDQLDDHTRDAQSRSCLLDDRVKTQVCTVAVKLKNEGKGFGLFLGFLAPSAVNHCQLPVVTDIEKHGSAWKNGIIRVGDRILEINGRITIGLALEELENIKDESGSADELVLLIEFDVNERDVKFGTFDVTMAKSYRTGIVYKDMKEGSPLVIKGLVKGSTAHRSGLLFPGDRILYTSIIRQQSFDSITGKIEDSSYLTMTIIREPLTANLVTETESELPLDCLDAEPSQLIRGSKFNVNRTSVHSLDGEGTLVLEHEVTLKRDSEFLDFGFLFGYNETTREFCITGLRPDSPAENCKVLKKSDRILEVNGIPLDKNSVSALSLFRQTGGQLKLKTRRILHRKN